VAVPAQCRLANVLEAYFDGRRELMAAKREKMLAELHITDHGLGVAPPFLVIADDVADFSALSSAPGCDRIETWLNNKVKDTAPQEPSPSLVAWEVPDVSDSNSDNSKMSLAKCWLRMKIDDYERYVGRIDTLDSITRPIVDPSDKAARTALMQNIFNVPESSDDGGSK
jgi:hypothetical protein